MQGCCDVSKKFLFLQTSNITFDIPQQFNEVNYESTNDESQKLSETAQKWVFKQFGDLLIWPSCDATYTTRKLMIFCNNFWCL